MLYFRFRLAIIAWAGLLQGFSLVLRNTGRFPSRQDKDIRGRKNTAQNGTSTKFFGTFADGVPATGPCLKGKKIILIGPSTSKADYLTLTFFAEYGRWPYQDEITYGMPPRSGPNPLYGPMLEYGLNVQGHVTPAAAYPCKVGTSESYLWYSNSVLNGHELCDCYKNDPVGEFQIADIYNQTENRIYVNGDTMIAYFQWFGDTVGPRGAVNLSPLTYLPLHLSPAKAVHQQCPVGQFKGSWEWNIPLQHFLGNFVRDLKPTHVVVDAAYWPINPHNVQYWDEVAVAGASAVSKSGGKVLWRTVPLRHDYPIPELSGVVDTTRFINNGWQLYDARTMVANYHLNRLDGDLFFDNVHLNPHSECQLVSDFLQTHICPAR